MHLEEAYPSSGEPVFTGKVYVEITCQFKQPKSTIREYPPYDVDNYAKSILDGITDHKGIWKDDDQVISLIITKEYNAKDQIQFSIIGD